MKRKQAKMAFLGILVALPQAVASQDVRLSQDDDGRQCARLGTELYAYLQTALPDCSRYCRVERDALQVTSENLNTMIFECADEDRAAAPLLNPGLGAAALGLLGLLLSASGNGDAGATPDTQAK